MTPRTNDALNSIHKLISRTTTYSEHFPRHDHTHSQNSNQNVLRLDYSLQSSVSQRPWTSESRGKYCRRIPILASRTQEGAVSVGRDDDIDAISEGDSDILGANKDGVDFSLLKGTDTQGKWVKQGVEIYRKESETGRKEMERTGKVAQSCEDMVGRSHGNVGDAQQYAEHNIVTPCGQELVIEAQSSNSRKATAAVGRAKLVDNWTQTEEEYFDATPRLSALLPQVQDTLSSNTDPQPQNGTLSTPAQAQPNRLPQAKVANKTTVSSTIGEKLQRYQPTPRLSEVSGPLNYKLDASQLVKFPLAKRPLSSIVDLLPTYNPLMNSGHARHYSADEAIFSNNNSHQVRTTEATRRLMGLYNGFNRTEVMQRFHKQYPEKAPDLREYSIREGRRHVIHGSHAYYFH